MLRARNHGREVERPVVVPGRAERLAVYAARAAAGLDVIDCTPIPDEERMAWLVEDQARAKRHAIPPDPREVARIVVLGQVGLEVRAKARRGA